MQKLLYVLWRSPESRDGAGAGALRAELTAALRGIEAVRSAQLNLVDAAVAAADGLRQIATQPPPDAFLQVWVDSAIAQLRAPLDALLAQRFARVAAYLLNESQPLRNRLHPPAPGERTAGFAQLALLRRPARLDPGPWRDIWQDSHTRVAIETQSTFEYTQNEIVRPLSTDAPDWVAMVEECFPTEAMSDPQVFFDARGDETKFQHNLRRMMDSVRRFLDLGTLDVLPTSQYRLFSR